jgi:hypothetical protein
MSHLAPNLCEAKMLKHVSYDWGYTSGSAGYIPQSLTDDESEEHSIETSGLSYDTDIAEYFHNIASHVQHSKKNILYDGNGLAPLPPPCINYNEHSHGSCMQPSGGFLRKHIPSSTNSILSLAADTADYFYIPLSARSTRFESLHHNHGIRFKHQSHITNLLQRWQQRAHGLVQKDARPAQLRGRIVASVKRKVGRMRKWIWVSVGRE